MKTLVITIIVMLVLAGVSINAIIGDNGVITNAQNAKLKNGMAALEEYIQQFYTEHYEEFSKSETPLTALRNYSDSANWFYKGPFGYVLDNSADKHIHYFLILENMPKEAIEGVIYGKKDGKTYADYQDLKDVYGLTEDLKVYYCKDGIETLDGVNIAQLSKEREDFGSTEAFASNSGLANVINGGTSNVTVADARKITNLSIKGSDGVSSLSSLYNLVVLDKLILNNMDLTTLEGLQYATNITTIFIQECTIEDYSAIAELPRIKQLYFYNTNDTEIGKLCDSTKGIGEKDIPSLRYFGIYGYQAFELDYNYASRNTLSSGKKSSFKNVNYLRNLSSVTKSSIQNLFLNNNRIENISYLYEFDHVVILRLENNYITSLLGLFDRTNNKKMSNLTYLMVNHNHLGEDIETETNFNEQNDALSCLANITKSGDNDIYSKNFNSLTTIDLSTNSYLKWLNYLNPYNSLSIVYLDGCENLVQSGLNIAVRVINDKAYGLSNKYSYDLALADPNALQVDLTNRTLTQNDFETMLNGKTKINKLKLNNLKITNIKTDSNINKVLNDTVKKLSTLKYLSFNGISGLTSVEFINGCTELIQLDLRGTGATDLSLLNEKMTKCRNIWIDNPGVDVTKIQDLFNYCGGDYGNGDPRRVLDIKITEGVVDVECRGVILCNDILIRGLKDCTRIEKFVLYGNCSLTETYDFSGCTNLDTSSFWMFSNRNAVGEFFTVKLPVTCEVLGREGYGAFQGNFKVDNASSLVNLKVFNSCFNSWDNIVEFVNLLPNISELNCYCTKKETSRSLNDLLNPEKFTGLSLFRHRSNYTSGDSWTNDELKIIGNFSNLKKLIICLNGGISEIPPAVENLVDLEWLDVSYTNVTSLFAIRNLQKLYHLNVAECPMFEEGFYTNLSGTSGLKCNNMDILRDLNLKASVENTSAPLRYLYLQGTKITDFSKISDLTWTEKNRFLRRYNFENK